MAFPKKGTRSIVVNDVKFLYRIQLRGKGEWRSENNDLDKTFMKYASYYGLGNVKDVNLGVVIQSASDSASSIFLKCHTVLVDGFMGTEQVGQVKPNLVAYVIRKALNEGWDPSKKGDYRLELARKWIDETPPVILQLPGMNEGIEDYENLERPIEVKLSD